jgi:hypothetical protein
MRVREMAFAMEIADIFFSSCGAEPRTKASQQSRSYEPESEASRIRGAELQLSDLVATRA